MSHFKYFPSFPNGAHLSTEACEHCGRTPAIPAGRLKSALDEEQRRAACADCLQAGKASVDVPSWVERELAQAVDQTHFDWSAEQRAELVASRVTSLAHTPPVPWLQNNEWPVCGDDFAAYVGELTREHLLREHGVTQRAKEALHATIDELRPHWDLDEEALDTAWEQLGNFVAIFEFRCPGNLKSIYVLQTA